MDEKITYLNTDFSTAPGVQPAIQFKDRTLRLEFIDWRKETIRMIFENVAAFCWQEAETNVADERNDCCYVIENSAWLARHVEQGKITDQAAFKHYKFCFSTAGFLEVLGTSMRTEI